MLYEFVLGDDVMVAQSTFYYFLIILQVPETIGTEAQLDEKTTSVDPLDRKREYFSIVIIFPYS